MSDDRRLGDIVTDGISGNVVLVGFPHDEGVRRNGGVVGSSGGPSNVKRIMKRMGTAINPEFKVELKPGFISDGGDVDSSLNLEAAHLALTEKVSSIIQRGGIPFVVGGGNDQSYPNAKGLLKNLKPEESIGVVNIDAHLDVRPLKEGKAHSGSPFRQLLEDTDFAKHRGKFLEFAAQGSQCSLAHVEYLESKKCDIVWLTKDLRNPAARLTIPQRLEMELENLGDKVFVSFDIDSISGRDAPGVSCPGTVGLTAEEAVEISYLAGRNPKVQLMDVSEYNPAQEFGFRTGRLIVNMFYYFCMGVAKRKEEGQQASAGALKSKL